MTALPQPSRILLVGMMGTGKSSIGSELARRTGWPFLDNDLLLERATGRTARELLADAGELGLRAGESAALREALATPPPAIVAVAGGVILDTPDRARLDGSGFVVWLRASAAELAQRATGAVHRPWLQEGAEAWFEREIATRASLYDSVADLTIDTERMHPSEAAEVILVALDAR